MKGIKIKLLVLPHFPFEKLKDGVPIEGEDKETNLLKRLSGFCFSDCPERTEPEIMPSNLFSCKLNVSIVFSLFTVYLSVEVHTFLAVVQV